MIGTPTYKIKPLPIKSSYFLEYNDSVIKGDKALNVFGKSEENEIDKFWWDSIKKKYLPWRGGVVVTNRGMFCFCVYVTWWANDQKKPTRLINRLVNGESIETEPITIYFWKSNPEKHDLYKVDLKKSICKSSKK